ncbi:MAG TPA: DNA polymerase III subunit delta [Anaerolineales bacterium]|nr:DNA polymerase III subunit delta [Anaerolineales bacterium]
MNDTTPVVYILHGDDEYGIAEFLRAMEEKLGDPTTADMNITRFEGGGYDVEDLHAAAAAMPFLAPRRLVVVDNVSKKYTRKEQYIKMTEMMDGLPPTTALVLAEKSPLKDSHWLMKWSKTAGDRAYVRAFNVPKGAQMTNWIRAYAGEKGGEISHQAAALLAENVQDVPRMAALEVEKLLAFVNYARPVDVDDVEMAAAFVGGQGDYFAFMDSIAARNGRKAMDMLQKLLDEQDPLPLFFSLVSHFRLVLQAREIYENGGTDQTVAKTLAIHPFRAKKMTVQARTMPLQSLENMYLRLQRLDLEIKTGQIDPALALESMVAELTAV